MHMSKLWPLALLTGSLLWGCPSQSDSPKSGPDQTSQSPAPQTAATSTKSAKNTPTQTKGPSIVHPPIDLPKSIGKRSPQHVREDLEAVELEGQLADGTTYTYMTFNKVVPGPLLRVRVDDTVEIHLKNLGANKLTHSIDLHAVTGPGGGSVLTPTPPGEEKVFTFKAIKPGLFVYHCATSMVAEHITNGMYGMIVVEPAAGLPAVDREFYVMQGELYTERPFGEYGLQRLSRSKLLAETPDYLVFNGAVGALTKEHPLQAKVGETVRIFFGVGGPNLIASFHVIGEHFDRLYNLASLTSPPLTTVQTVLVPPGGAALVELKLEVPGRYLLVDHALSRLEKGLLGFLQVEGPAHPELFHEVGAEKSPDRNRPEAGSDMRKSD
jgi:nitrite reductase (NO-forming)